MKRNFPHITKKLVETFPVKELFNLDYTGRLEKTLLDIEKGKFKRNTFTRNRRV